MAEMTVDKLVLADIPRGTYQDEGLTYLDVGWIYAYLDEHLPVKRDDAAWRSLIPQWLSKLGTELDGTYEVCESENFTFLLPKAQDSNGPLIKEAERSLDLGLRFLSGIARDEGVGKHVAICMDTHDEYYSYIAHYDPDGEHGASTGTCFKGTGYTHLVLNKAPELEQRYTISHEICHALLSHLRLPRWVEEGLVQIAEGRIQGKDSGDTFPGQIHSEYWRDHTFAEYWLGSAFHISGDGQHLAYGLAHRMVSDLLKFPHDQFIAFVLAADSRDAGQAAAIEHLGKTLAQCLPPFLQIEFTPPR